MGSLLCYEYLTINLKMNLFRSKQQIKPPLPGKYIRTINCFIWIVELLKRSYLYSLSTFEKCNDHHAHVNKFDFLIRIQVIVQLAIGIEQFTDSAVQERNMAIILRLLSAYFGWKGIYVFARSYPWPFILCNCAMCFWWKFYSCSFQNIYNFIWLSRDVIALLLCMLVCN